MIVPTLLGAERPPHISSIVYFHDRPLLVRKPSRAEDTLGIEEVFERDGCLVFSLRNGVELKCTCKHAGCSHRRDVREFLAVRRIAASDLMPFNRPV